MNNRLVDLLISKGYKISCAESCTGGLLCAKIVEVPNASKVLDASFVTYANEAKINLLGVKESTIAKYGVVSEEVAREMAIGVVEKANCQVGVGISGIAGPTGATQTKPVGMVCFGFKVGDLVVSRTVYFGNLGRNVVREQAANYAIESLIEILINN